ncbi:MAG: STAS domain-containing protein [Syntrophobacteraceae bacterium]|nr:STAS domain-containing protein [Syntrophobacteraceae bacterium]NTV42647.1 STAS domain-containing protein [Syntrophobacteraceae bacterium]
MSGTVSRQTPLPVALEGSLDFNTVPDLRKNLLKTLRKGASPSIELDFSRVSKVDTSGIAMLVELNRIAVSKGGNVSLTGMNEQVRRMMRLARLDGIFSLEDVGGVGLEP